VSRTPPTELDRLSAEWLAAADALRMCRTQLYRLVAIGDPAILGQLDTSVVLCGGLDVAQALESLAARIVADHQSKPSPEKES
jgi:hypothetical protein